MNAQVSTQTHHPSTSPALSTSSLYSQDGRTTQVAPTIIEEASASPNGASVASNPKKPTLSHRLTRMFSQNPGKPVKETDVSETSREKHIEGSTSDTDSNGASAPSKPTPPSRQSSTSDKGPSTVATTKKDLKDTDPNHKRFEILQDGVHEHHLKSCKRQEKLSVMLRDMLGGGRKKDEHGPSEDQQLSLMSTWVDQLKHERERLASDKKGGPNASATLVQKYGKCQEIVGRGAFGIVRISHKTDPKDSKVELLYAVKEFRRRPQESPKKYQKRLTAEFCISSSLRHPNVIHTLDLLQDAKGDYCEVMEFCAGGDLYTLVLAAGKLEVAEADCYFKQLMCGVEYLHEMGVAHRDLKPENLLLTTHGSLKITDFGNGECFRMAWEKEAHMTGGLCGSAPYIAPEEYVDKEFDPRAVDVWATGVIYMAMRTGRHLWRVAKKDEDEFFERYLEGRRDEDGYGPIELLHRVT